MPRLVRAGPVRLRPVRFRLVRFGLAALCCAVVPLAVAAPVAGTPLPDDEPPGELIPVPVGCLRPEPAVVAFVGTTIGKDDVTQVVRFRIDQLRAGSAAPWAIDGLIDIRYGDDYRFLGEGEQYLVGAGSDPVFGVLSSTVRPPAPNFGGNDVVGVDDIAVECPELDDPIRTLNVDGTSVDTGVLSLLTEDRRLLLATIAVPTAIAFAALIALVLLKSLGRLAALSAGRLARAAVTPVPDHRVARVRTHRSLDEVSVSTGQDAADRRRATGVEEPASRFTSSRGPR